MLRDSLRCSFRSLRRNPGFAIAAIFALGLGIGSNTAMFSVVHRILLSEVPFGQASFEPKGIVNRFPKKDSKLLFQLEMLTRNPLKVPIFTDPYWRVYDEKSSVPPRDLARLIAYVRNHPPKKPFPHTSGLSAGQALALEDKLNQQCIDYARANLPTLA